MVGLMSIIPMGLDPAKNILGVTRCVKTYRGSC